MLYFWFGNQIEYLDMIEVQISVIASVVIENVT